MYSKIESILFFSGEPVNLGYLCRYFKIDRITLDRIISQLKEKYNNNSGIILKIYGDSAILETNKNNYQCLIDFFNLDKSKTLTNAAIEVLSIIAYKQPVTKAEIDHIRGVKSDNIIRRLIDEKFIFVSGTLEGPGRPNLYKTTDLFLKEFDLESLKKMPEIELEFK